MQCVLIYSQNEPLPRIFCRITRGAQSAPEKEEIIIIVYIVSLVVVLLHKHTVCIYHGPIIHKSLVHMHRAQSNLYIHV